MSSSSTRSHPPPPHVIEDCRGLLQLLSDGTLRRSPDPISPTPTTLSYSSIIFKDTQFNSTHNLTLRLYKPLGPHRTKLPVLFYFHGGGFCLGSFAWPHFHNACLRLASDLNAVIVAPDYRLAPEARLPAAIDDAVSAVDWIRAESDPFLTDADFSNIFISGESAGGNLTHHLALKFGARLKGYILLLPFFSGAQRTESEASCDKNAFLDLELSDRYWRLALPAGATRDDPLANPFGPGGPAWEEDVVVGPMVVVVGGEDLLRDRGKEYGRRLREMGKNVEVVEIGGQQHGFFPMSPLSAAADELVTVIKKFMDENQS